MHHSVDVRIDVEKSCGGSFLAQGAGENGKAGFGTLRKKTVGVEFLNQCDAIAFPGRGIQGTDARKGIEGNLVGVIVERFRVQAAQIGFGMQKEVAEDYGAEFLNGLGEALVSIVGHDSFLQLRHQPRVNDFATFLPAFEVGP